MAGLSSDYRLEKRNRAVGVVRIDVGSRQFVAYARELGIKLEHGLILANGGSVVSQLCQIPADVKMRLGIVRRKLDRAAAGGERLVITGLPRARDVGVEFADARLRLSIAWIDSKSGAERLKRGIEASVLLADQAEQVVRLGEVWIESERLDELVARLVKASRVGQ